MFDFHGLSPEALELLTAQCCDEAILRGEERPTARRIEKLGLNGRVWASRSQADAVTPRPRLTMSLVTVSAGAKDFTDNSKIEYAEAVDVVSAAKVIDGYADGSFNPSATLTRGAAAKIICNLILGPTTAEALVANAAPYKRRSHQPHLRRLHCLLRQDRHHLRLCRRHLQVPPIL